MITEVEFEKACLAASERQGRSWKRRIRPRAAALTQDAAAEWTSTGPPRADIFWPRYEDLYLVAAGLRCAVLLDSRRAARSAPPLSEVLLRLQSMNGEEVNGNGGCGCRDHHHQHMASLGLLRLEDSCFLVNRDMLRARLDRILVPSSLDQFPSSSSASIPLVPPVWRDCGFLDVTGSLRAPRLCVDGTLQQKLRAALCSVFGGSGGYLRYPVSAETPPCCSSQETMRGCGSSPQATSRSTPAFAFGTNEFEGAHWLRDWRQKETILGGDEVRERLGDVGLPGLAGWLLEYPVIYCCPSPSQGARGEGKNESATRVRDNCLAAEPLLVYTLRAEFAQTSATMQHESRTSFEAFSFSVPETTQNYLACSGDNDHAEAGVSEDQNRKNTLGVMHAFVDEFLETFEARVARHNDVVACIRCCRDRQRCILHLNVSKRRETLDRVVL